MFILVYVYFPRHDKDLAKKNEIRAVYIRISSHTPKIFVVSVVGSENNVVRVAVTSKLKSYLSLSWVEIIL